MPSQFNTPQPYSLNRGIVVGVRLKTQSPIDQERSLEELKQLLEAAGAQCVGSFLQVLPQYQSTFVLGKGKVQEVKQGVQELQAGLVVVDHELSGSQLRNWERELGVRVVSRAQLILDIFAQRARSYEGRLQVELAQLLDQLPRVVGGWLGSLSRLAGGIGTRGPGETALEIDRRRIKTRISFLKSKLNTVRKTRHLQRTRRMLSQVPSFALVGYTNSGKSTLLQALSHSEVLAKDQVFATLDPLTRSVHLPPLGKALVTDTVGFISRLPTKILQEAFKATLEESESAHVILHVVDVSHPQALAQAQTTSQVLQELKWNTKPQVWIFNKADSVGTHAAQNDQAPTWNLNPEAKHRLNSLKNFARSLPCAEGSFWHITLSAKKQVGIDKLKDLMGQSFSRLQKEYSLYFPHAKAHLLYELNHIGQVLKTEYSSTGLVVQVRLSHHVAKDWKEFVL